MNKENRKTVEEQNAEIDSMFSSCIEILPYIAISIGLFLAIALPLKGVKDTIIGEEQKGVFQTIISSTTEDTFIVIEISGEKEIVSMKEPLTTLWLSDLEKGKEYTFTLRDPTLKEDTNYRKIIEIDPIEPIE